MMSNSSMYMEMFHGSSHRWPGGNTLASDASGPGTTPGSSTLETWQRLPSSRGSL